MSNAVRVSMELNQLASREAAVMGRSVAQQIDYWARVGARMEKMSGVSVAKIRQALSGEAAFDDLNAAERGIALSDLDHGYSNLKPGRELAGELRASGVPYTEADSKGRLVQVMPDGSRRPLHRPRAR